MQAEPTHSPKAIRIHVPITEATAARILPCDVGADELRGLRDGHLLGVFHLGSPEDVHPHLWNDIRRATRSC